MGILTDDNAEKDSRWEALENFENYFDWKSLATIENEVNEQETERKNGDQQE